MTTQQQQLSKTKANNKKFNEIEGEKRALWQEHTFNAKRKKNSDKEKKRTDKTK